ncbi:MAG: hypothetical protein MZV64_29750 [Ignavibacteriales bacterium]|nr:hypothetical protein [Ignavibacteriales bacterium]
MSTVAWRSFPGNRSLVRQAPQGQALRERLCQHRCASGSHDVSERPWRHPREAHSVPSTS